MPTEQQQQHQGYTHHYTDPLIKQNPIPRVGFSYLWKSCFIVDSGILFTLVLEEVGSGGRGVGRNGGAYVLHLGKGERGLVYVGVGCG
jgi:hypothetical protein